MAVHAQEFPCQSRRHRHLTREGTVHRVGQALPGQVGKREEAVAGQATEGGVAAVADGVAEYEHGGNGQDRSSWASSSRCHCSEATIKTSKLPRGYGVCNASVSRASTTPRSATWSSRASRPARITGLETSSATLRASRCRAAARAAWSASRSRSVGSAEREGSAGAHGWDGRVMTSCMIPVLSLGGGST